MTTGGQIPIQKHYRSCMNVSMLIRIIFQIKLQLSTLNYKNAWIL